jgi:small-conductance mechanosensitive channel
MGVLVLGLYLTLTAFFLSRRAGWGISEEAAIGIVIVAGLGIGGLAVALAAQKTVENLFGGLTLITDQPVRAGDFCRVGGWIGTVEDVGLRSTRIRTLDRTVVTIPNAAFAAMELENFARRDRIFFHPILNLRYETTPDQLRWLLVALKRLLVSHPMVSPEPARVRFVALGAHSLDLELFAYVRTTDFDEFLAVQEDLLLRIMDLVEESGTGFAFPSQTLYAAPDPGVDAERRVRAVEHHDDLEGRRRRVERRVGRERGPKLRLPADRGDHHRDRGRVRRHRRRSIAGARTKP